MPLTFIDIEKQKSWRIWVFFIILMLLYLLIFLALAVPLLPRALHSPSGFWFFGLAAFLVAGIHFLFSGYNAVSSVISTLEAQPPDPKDSIHSMLTNIMAEIHVVTGNRRKIQCVVIPSLSMNALAAADLKGDAVIGITEGLLSRLSRPQLESVIAHEANHILSGDCLETTTAASLFSSLSSLLDRYSEASLGRSFPHPVLIPAWVLLQASYVLNMFISREREYRADAASVRMTRNPVALAETLYLLSRGWRGAGFIGSGLETLCIVNPVAMTLDETEGFWADLISTHPPIQKRMDILLAMARVSITELEARAGRKTRTDASGTAEPLIYAMNPQQQWQGPFTMSALTALTWLSPLTWVTQGKEHPVVRASKEPSLNAIFLGRLAEQKHTLSSFSCPLCKQPLATEAYAGTQVYQCQFCAGILVEAVKIPRIIARTGREKPCSERINSLARAALQNNLRQQAYRKHGAGNAASSHLLGCPKCSNPMFRGFYSQAHLIEIDRCSFCGLTWFDRDELEMLQCLIENRIVPDMGDQQPEVGRT